MLHEINHTEKRISRRLELVKTMVYRRWHALPALRYCELPGPQAPALAGPEVDDHDWPIIEPDTYWGKRTTDFVLRTHFQAPGGWVTTADAPIVLVVPLSHRGDYCTPETLAYVDGVSLAGCDRNHQEIVLGEHLLDGRPHLLALRGWTGRAADHQPEAGRQLYMRPAGIAQVDQPTRDLIAAVRVALDVVRNLAATEPARAYILNALDEAFAILDLREPMGEAFYASVPVAHETLRRGLARAGQPLDVDIVATGHSHLDVAWLWSLDQTRRKAGRTFHTVMRLMEQFPDYHFTQSQPQLYEYIRQDYPELFEEIRARVAEGRWEPIGGMWVEADCNLSGAESLARQFLLGRSFFRQHFGSQAETPVLWLPDVFGYAWNLPQLIREAGLEYFYTIKLSWNQYNRIPYDSFWWQGLDGTRVLTHFGAMPDYPGSATTTYNSMATPAEAIDAWKHFQQRELHQELLMAYGFGDGGGGPSREMLENIREMSAFPGAPRLCQGSVRDFFTHLEQGEGQRLPTWNGELYFELHRGTYTTQARNKRANRRSEFLLHDAEFLATLAATANSGYAYPQAALRDAWQTVALNQFHDIIPGSSIGEVYQDSQAQYRAVAAAAGEVTQDALAHLAAGPEYAGAGLLLANPTAFARRDLALWPGFDAAALATALTAGMGLCRADGTPVALQPAADGGAWLDAGELAPLSVTPLYLTATSAAAATQPAAPCDQSLTSAPPRLGLSAGTRDGSELIATLDRLENALLRVDINAAGDIVRIFDKANGRDVLPRGAVANQFQAFEDRPLDWDAWDVDIFYEEKRWLAEPASSIEVIECGPLVATLEIRRRILHSDYVQRISLAAGSATIDFRTQIDWRERHTLLKVAFPVDVFSPTATYEIQWGNVERPTHRNTSWDWARFETCAHKWVDLSEGDYGVSLLNDCKYGHDIHDNVMRISLLRSPTMPDPEADQGRHEFSYRLLPHAGRWNEQTVAAAYQLNDPILVYRPERPVSGGTVPAAPAAAFLGVDAPNVVVETIKQAEDGRGIIVRLYENQRCRGRVTLTAGFAMAGAWRTNILEEERHALPVAGNTAQIDIRPYEIVTLRLVPER